MIGFVGGIVAGLSFLAGLALANFHACDVDTGFSGDSAAK
jgi:hypothetical protein